MKQVKIYLDPDNEGDPFFIEKIKDVECFSMEISDDLAYQIRITSELNEMSTEEIGNVFPKEDLLKETEFDRINEAWIKKHYETEKEFINVINKKFGMNLNSKENSLEFVENTDEIVVLVSAKPDWVNELEESISKK